MSFFELLIIFPFFTHLNFPEFTDDYVELPTLQKVQRLHEKVGEGECRILHGSHEWKHGLNDFHHYKFKVPNELAGCISFCC